MTDQRLGAIGWIDLTVPNADEVRDFYQAVVGWEPQSVDMGEYSDYNMTRSDGTPAAGVCHARGTNAGLPPVWMIYVTVADADASAAKATELGGEVVDGPKSFGPNARYCVIKDPAGAFLALYSQASE